MPFLGICLGLQALFERSEEAPEVAGLGIFRARSSAFPPMRACRTWAGTQLDCAKPARLLQGLGPQPYVYFAHSYYVPVTASDRRHLHLHAALHGGARSRTTSSACSSIPRSPGAVGLQIVRNFVEL